MKIYLRFILFFSISIFLSSTIFAQETGGVKGKVRTASGDGIAGAIITARQNGEDVKSATSDSKGIFALENLKSGIYNIVFSKKGYSSGVLYNVEVRKKKVGDLGERLILSVDKGTQVIIVGSVFTAEGRSAGGAEVKIERISGDGSPKKVGSTIANYSGEFSFRFPEGAAKYRITASAKDVKAIKEIEVDNAAIYRLAITLDAPKDN